MIRTSYIFLVLFLVSCGEEIEYANTRDLSDSINHSYNLQQIKQRKRLDSLKRDSLRNLAREITRFNTMKEVNMINEFEKLKDSLVHEIEVEHEIVHQLQTFSRDSFIFDTIYEYKTVYDTVIIYDSVLVKYSKLNKKRNK